MLVHLSEQFGLLNCHLDLVGNNAELIDAMKRRAYELVFLHLSSSVSAGQETVGQIRRALPPASETWLVALVPGELQTPEREAYRTAGINDYLITPFTQAQLAATLERAKWRLPG